MMQSSSQIVTANKPTANVFTGQTHFLSFNQQCRSSEGKTLSDVDGKYLLRVYLISDFIINFVRLWVCVCVMCR